MFCGADILWKPKGMDFNVKYDGPKPLDPDTGKKHNCKQDEILEEPEGKLGSLDYFLHHGYPSLQKHYTRAFYHGSGIQQLCGDPKCPCGVIADRWIVDPEKAAQWNKDRAEWLKQWPSEPSDSSRFLICCYCEKKYKVMPYSVKGMCDDCYWQKVWENGGLPYSPFGYDYSSVGGMSS